MKLGNLLPSSSLGMYSAEDDAIIYSDVIKDKELQALDFKAGQIASNIFFLEPKNLTKLKLDVFVPLEVSNNILNSSRQKFSGEVNQDLIKGTLTVYN